MLEIKNKEKSKMKFEIDCAEGKKPFYHFWNGIGFSPASLLLNADMKQQIEYIGSIPFNGIRYVRIHSLLDLMKIDNMETVNPVYRWDILDQCIDVLIENNLLPFFELMGNPEKYFTDFLDDIQIRKWKDFICQLALHFITRYGIKCVLQWYFETWNEPDGLFWSQSEKAFCNYYDACSEGLNEASKELKLGGPGTCIGRSTMFKAFLAHCDTGINYFTKEKGVRLDFISIHEKGALNCVEDINPDSKKIIEREQDLRDYIIKTHPGFENIPFINNECDVQVGWWDTHTWRAKAYYPAIAVKIINQHVNSFIDQGVNYALLSNDNGFVGSWGRRTVMARFGLKEDQKAQSEYRISEDEFVEDRKRRKFAMIKKPVLSVMALLAFLGDERCQVKTLNHPGSDLGILATLREKNQIAVLIYNSCDKIMSSGDETVQLFLTGIPFSKGILTEYRIEEDFTDPFSVWEKNGIPQIPDIEILGKMRDESELKEADKSKEINIKKGELIITTTLPIPAVRLFLISKETEKLPIKVSPPDLKVYEGLDENYEDIRIKWPCINSYKLRTYEVLYRQEGDSEFTRINKVNTVFSLWLHTRRKGKKGEYKVRAVDFWNRKGMDSETVLI